MPEVRFFAPPSPAETARVIRWMRKVISTKTVEKHYEPGSFEIVLPTEEMVGYPIRRGCPVLIDKTFCGIIDDIKYVSDSGGNRVTLSGYDLLGILRWRNIVPTDYISTDGTAGYDARTGASETIIKGFIADNIVTPPQIKRKLDGVMLAHDMGRGIPDDKYMARFQVLADVVSEIARDAKLGLRAIPIIQEGTPFGVLFDCLNGIDRTADQSVNNRAIFDIDRRSITSMEHRDSEVNYANAFYTTRGGSRSGSVYWGGGEFADEQLTLLYWRDGEDEPLGWDRRETWQQISVGGNVPAGEEYTELKRQALIKAKQFEYISSFTAVVNDARLQYRKHYNLGDVVTVRNEAWGITMDTEIVAVEVVNGGRAKVTFGTDVPTQYKLLEQRIKEV